MKTMNDITITHYRYKASEVAELYKLAKDYEIDPDKLIKDRHFISTHQVGGIKREDIFPRGGITVMSDGKGNFFDAVCSFKDNYDRRRGVNICMGRLAKYNSVPF